MFPIYTCGQPRQLRDSIHTRDIDKDTHRKMGRKFRVLTPLGFEDGHISTRLTIMLDLELRIECTFHGRIDFE